MRIISGGQTGVDRAALDAALELGLPCGGWCPKGRRAEDGPIDEKYPLKETKSDDYAVRTEWNARDSDGTLIITRGKPKGGTAYTIAMCRVYKKPCLVIDLCHCEESAEGGRRGNLTNTVACHPCESRDLECISEIPPPLLHGGHGASAGMTRNIHSWLANHNIKVLNIAGPRESNLKGIYKDAKEIFLATFSSGRRY